MPAWHDSCIAYTLTQTACVFSHVVRVRAVPSLLFDVRFFDLSHILFDFCQMETRWKTSAVPIWCEGNTRLCVFVRERERERAKMAEMMSHECSRWRTWACHTTGWSVEVAEQWRNSPCWPNLLCTHTAAKLTFSSTKWKAKSGSWWAQRKASIMFCV